ncbi:MAG TPA: HAD family hydrolase [Mycobacteriales bacterium]|nr:HAD family hydrolase [Mycobacteriales bacterium]
MKGVLFDIDGTLVDTNYLHAVTWAEAFRSCGYAVATSRLHHLIGQGSDRLVTSVLGKDDPAVAEAHADFYGPHLHHLCAFDGAADLLRKIRASGVSVVLATSAAKRDARFLADAIDADDAIDHLTTNDDADSSKPDPDIVNAALRGAGLDAADCVFVGDTTWDVEAAKRAGMPCICVLTGGIDERELRDAGAIEIYEDVSALHERLAQSAIGALIDR